MRHALTDHQVAAFAASVAADGFCILRDHIDRALLERWRGAFQPLLDRHIEREGHRQNRGSNRYYVTLPFVRPFADPAVYEDQDVLAIVERLVGDDLVLHQLASDTPVRGSDFQAYHRDAMPLFPETRMETPAFQLAVNFPLVAVTNDNGPLEITRATHMITREAAVAGVESGRIAVEPVLMDVGDVMIRDVRGLHRGTPNRTDVPRPMVVLGYSRTWLHRPEVNIRIPREEWDKLSERARRMLRFNPIVATIEEALQLDGEIYQAYAF